VRILAVNRRPSDFVSAVQTRASAPDRVLWSSAGVRLGVEPTDCMGSSRKGVLLRSFPREARPRTADAKNGANRAFVLVQPEMLVQYLSHYVR
jgi:hypothetical protein